MLVEDNKRMYVLSEMQGLGLQLGIHAEYEFL